MTTSDQTRDHTHDSSATQEGPVAAAACAAVPARVGDFEIVARLGQGAFAQVFLARQVSLGRAVALKLSAREPAGCDEGRLLASLEHDHIVKVFAAFADPDTGLRGLCLQYVPGADLGAIIRHLHAHGPPAGGAAILAALDELRHGDPGFDPAALRDREALAASDFPQAVCLLGAKLAEALAFAHARGVLHCDIKPGNILLTPYGRPLLADFNVAFARAKHDPASGRYGGTLAYMAPEYRAAVMGNPGGAADERCDLFSLGVVLHELATGARPAPAGPSPESEETLMPGAAPAGRLPPRPLDAPATLPRELAAVIRRALDPDPAARYQTAADLAAALSGARQLLALRRSLPPPPAVGRWAVERPGAALALAGLLPHLVASVVQIGYNAVEVHLGPAQERAFLALVVAYNLVAYSVCGGLGMWYFWRVNRQAPIVPAMPGPAVDRFRREVLLLSWRVAALGALGWLPGGLLFPVFIDLFAGPLPAATYGHYLVSFTLAGLIGVVFSYLAVACVVFRALLPRLGNPDAFAADRAWAEVRPLTAPLGALLTLACGVPLVGAVLLLALAEGALTLGFRVLVVGLIGAGVASVGLAERIVRRLRQLAAVWQTDRGAR